MSIQKKSLIGNRAAAKKAIIATNVVSTNLQPVEGRPGLSAAKGKQLVSAKGKQLVSAKGKQLVSAKGESFFTLKRAVSTVNK